MGEADNSKDYVPFDSMEDMLDCYRQSLEAKNRSHKTISWYLDILKRFFTFLELNGQLRPVNQLGRKELEAYILYLKEATRWPNKTFGKTTKCNLSPFSIQGHARAVKAFWSWLEDEGYIDNNPLAGFPLPKVPKTIINTLSMQQFNKLISQLDKSTPFGARCYCILLLLMDTGMRISEVVSIRMEDIDITKSFVKVLGKGQKERVVPITKAPRKELIKYINNIRKSLCKTESPYLFATRDGEHITVNGVQQAIRRLAEKANLQGIKCHPHIFRHTFATYFIAKGGAETALQNILGHESSQTTKKYIHLQPSDLKKQHDKYSPLADLFGY